MFVETNGSDIPRFVGVPVGASFNHLGIVVDFFRVAAWRDTSRGPLAVVVVVEETTQIVFTWFDIVEFRAIFLYRHLVYGISVRLQQLHHSGCVCIGKR